MSDIERLRALLAEATLADGIDVAIAMTRAVGGNPHDIGLVMLDALPALLDVAEAARAFMEDEIGWNGPNAYLIFSSVDGPPIRALRAALDRLDGPEVGA